MARTRAGKLAPSQGVAVVDHARDLRGYVVLRGDET